MIDRAGRTITYDYENRATSISYGSSTVDSVYDYSGQRVKKITSSLTTVYIGKLYECGSGNCTKYIFAGGNRLASKTASNTYYYHTDHLGSSSIITDASGNKVEEIYYYPFGGVRLNTGSVNVKHKFTGQEEDAETGLYYYGARYYDPQLGRFITADSIVPDPSNPQALNRYSYALNNPLRYIDPTGHGFWDKVLGVVEIVVGAVIIYYSNGNPYGSAVGLALIADGVRRLNGGEGETGGSMSCSSDGSCSGSAYSGTGGGGSGGGGSGSGGSTYSDYNYGNTGSYGPWDVPLTFRKYAYETNLEFEDVYGRRDRWNIDSYLGNEASGKKTDWVDVTLAGISSGSALVALGAPAPQVKAVAAGIGTFSTFGGVTYSIYKYSQGTMTKGQLALKISLDIAPIFGKGIGRAVGKWINPDAGHSIDAAMEVLEHQKGLIEGGKSLLYDPNR